MSFIKKFLFIMISIIFISCLVDSTDVESSIADLLNRDSSLERQTNSLSFINQEPIQDGGSSRMLESSLVIKHDDTCYGSFRLPDNIKPRHYDLMIEPEIRNFTFQGAVAIESDIDMNRLVDLNVSANEQTENTDQNTHKNRISRNTSDKEKIRTIEDNQIVLNINDIDLTSAWYLNEKNVTIKVKEACVSHKYQVVVLNMENSLTSGRGKVYMTFRGKIGNDTSGLYRSKYTAANGEIRYHAVTQFEPKSARKVFPCFDEPAFKATFDVTLIAPKNRLALANTHAVAELDLGEKRAIKFATSPLMSTYLVAFVIGEFDHIEGKSRGRPVRVYTAIGEAKLGKFALNVAMRCLPFMEDYFKIALPLSKIDIVAIPDFGIGVAMENWGLISYKKSAMLIDEEHSPLWAKIDVAHGVIHELAHQWLGNLVTMFWWDGLWLKEGFSTYMQYYVTSELFPEYSMVPKFIKNVHISALDEDASHSTHPISADVVEPFELEIYDEISYFKGASLVRFLHEYLSDDVFRAGLQHYLSKNAYKNTVNADLWQSFEFISGKPIAKMMRSWTDQPGFPCLNVSVIDTNDSITELEITQKRFLDDGIFLPGEDEMAQWTIPLSIITGNSPNSIAHKSTLSTSSIRFAVKNSKQWIKLNPNFIGFYRVNYQKQLREALYPAIESKQLSASDRLNLLSDAYSLTKAEKKAEDDLLRMLTYYKDEDDGAVWEVIIDVYTYMDDAVKVSIHRDRFREFGRQFFKNVYELYGWDRKPDEPSSTTLARSKILSTCLRNNYKPVIEEGLRRFDLHFFGRQLAEPSIRDIIYRIAAQHGRDDQYVRLFKMFKQTDSRQEQNVLATSMTSIVEKRDRALGVIDWMMSSPAVLDRKLPDYSATLSGKGKNFLFKKIEENFEEFLEKFGTVLSDVLRDVIFLSREIPTEQIVRDINVFFKKHNSEDADKAQGDITIAIKTHAEASTLSSESINQFLQHYLTEELPKPK